MTEASFIYAYDGSGVPMSTAVTVVAIDGEHATIKFGAFVPRRDDFVGEVDFADGTRRVRAANLKPIGQHFPLASFNFLD